MNATQWPETCVSEMSDLQFEELFNLLEEPTIAEHGGQLSRLAKFLGFWRSTKGANLRVGKLVGQAFVPAAGPSTETVSTQDKISLTMRQVSVPDLPHNQCVVQIAWRAQHWFDDNQKSEVAHTTSCVADEAGTAGAVGLPVFHNMKATDGLAFSLDMYAMADRGSNTILDLLNSSEVKTGLQLSSKFNPVFAMTVPYVNVAIGALTKLSKRNFRLISWKVGLGTGGAPIPLGIGEFILLDGTIRLGTSADPLAWSKLTWDPDRECPMYDGGPFRNPYIMIRIEQSS